MRGFVGTVYHLLSPRTSNGRNRMSCDLDLLEVTLPVHDHAYLQTFYAPIFLALDFTARSQPRGCTRWTSRSGRSRIFLVETNRTVDMSDVSVSPQMDRLVLASTFKDDVDQLHELAQQIGAAVIVSPTCCRQTDSEYRVVFACPDDDRLALELRYRAST